MVVLWIVAAVVVLFGFAAFFGAPYLPSQRKYLRRAFAELYPLSKKDTLVDLGSGDGVVLRVAREFDATVVGYEINPILVLISRLLSRGDKKVTIKQSNFWVAPLPDSTTVIYVFSVSRDGRRLIKKVRREVDRIGKPISVMCHASPLPGLEPEKTLNAFLLYTFHPLQPSEA